MRALESRVLWRERGGERERERYGSKERKNRARVGGGEEEKSNRE